MLSCIRRNHTSLSRYLHLGAWGALALAGSLTAARAAEFVKPTAEELSMTSLPGYPGVAAVVLYREEITRDDMHSVEHYERIKVLSEEGKKYANIELGYVTSTGDFFYSGDGKSMDGISGRTIHADGTVIPFTGKPYHKLIEKTSGYKVQENVFTLPDVEVGSILECRWTTRINDNIFEAPIWRVQDDLFVREAHFAWWPTNQTLIDEDEKPINAITWLPILPAGAKIESRSLPPSSSLNQPSRIYELHIKDVPPRVREEHMPPLGSFSYRVNFAFSPYSTQTEYWNANGKQWSKHFNSFANPNAQLKQATDKVTAGAATPEEKLRKIYAAVMALENTSYTREHDNREDKVAGLAPLKTAADVLARGRGTPYQLTELFVGMVRAAGLEAYGMRVPNREETIFVPGWMDARQFDTVIAIVPVDGKDRYFDPGARYCGYGQLAWQHTLVGGQRQTPSGTALIQTPGTSYQGNHVKRVATLTMSEGNEVSGKVDMTYIGSPAVHWREVALSGDDESFRRDLRHNLEDMLPKAMEVEIAAIEGLDAYDQPLVVHYRVKGGLGTPMGKRLMVPADLFVAGSPATFPHEKRESAVYFHYPELVQDAVRITYPAGLSVEALPASAKYILAKEAAYGLSIESAGNSITARRDFALGDVLIPSSEYKDLRAFYSQLETKDQESVVLKVGPAEAQHASTEHAATTAIK